jgi:nucleotide-binding universal stress UspA family protein
MEERGRRRAVVGVDGSPASRAALRWTIEWVATAGGGTVEAVHTWQTPYVYGPMGGALVTVDREPVEAAATSALTDALEGVEVPDEVALRPVLAEGPCAQSLLDRASGADLLALGTRGRGGFAGLLLGSVTQQCLHHATCPVVILPAPEAARGR